MIVEVTERGRYLDELPRLLELAAARVGGLLETTSIGGAVGMKKDTVRRYLALLELLYLTRRIPAWSRNFGQRLIRSPKLSMPDTGLACELLGSIW